MRRVVVLALALLLPACARELLEPSPAVQSSLGHVRIPLRTSESDTTYVLRSATLELSGSVLLTVSADPSSDVLVVPAPVGKYTVFLRPEFALVALAADGTERPVTATIAGPNPRRVHVSPIEDTRMELRFEVEGREIVLGERPSLRASRSL